LLPKDLGYTSKGFRAKQRGRDELVRFSYTDVISPPKQQALVAEALTREALEITRQFRADAFASGPVQCALTAREVPENTMADVVHLNPPRAQLHQKFLASEGLTYKSVEMIKHPTESGSDWRTAILLKGGGSFRTDTWRDWRSCCDASVRPQLKLSYFGQLSMTGPATWIPQCAG
jgi:hypothetical protein